MAALISSSEGVETNWIKGVVLFGSLIYSETYGWYMGLCSSIEHAISQDPDVYWGGAYSSTDSLTGYVDIQPYSLTL